MNNILTIDVEDWHSLVQRRITGIMPPPSNYIFRQINRLLDLLDRHQTKATFFVLGLLAESHPELAKQIVARGHEIASHGYSHLPLYKISPEKFKEETRRSKMLLEDITGTPINGYRAAEFSIIKQTLWALEILAELGFTYDSSIFPMHHRRYGIHDFSQSVCQYFLRNNLKIIEIPLSIFSLGKLAWAFSGGGYFRLLPLRLLHIIMARLNAINVPVIAYFHPYEFDPSSLNSFQYYTPIKLKEWIRAYRYNFHQNLGRFTVYEKLSILLKQYRFITCQEYLATNEIREMSLVTN